ncbi:MAG TPA: matrixin family metalloprotease [Solirubrobacterales bacterium]|nr:matrixin family metalloprotease [Solirubrobacterales bacterium]
MTFRGYIPVLAAVVLVGLLPTDAIAVAGSFTPELEGDYAFAAHWWGLDPTGCSEIVRETVSPAEIDGDAGRATQPVPDAAPAPCAIEIAPEAVQGELPCVEEEVVLHEYGHLLGFDHSAVPGSIMSAERQSNWCDVKNARAELSGILPHYRAHHSYFAWVKVSSLRNLLRELVPPLRQR